jgi:hypothetical protein
VNSQLTYQATIAQIHELHRQAANQRLTRQSAGSRHRLRIPRPRRPTLGFIVRPRERAALPRRAQS